MIYQTLRRAIATALICLAALAPIGCATHPPAVANYNALFAQNRYADSYDAAAKVAGSKNPLLKDHASLVAGLSARALDRTADAKRWLTPIANNADASIAGQASAALGAIALEEGRHRDAAPLFLSAGTKLKGDDAARAFMYAGDSLLALGKPADANAAYLKAQGQLASDSQLKVALGDRLAGGGPPPSTAKATPQPSGGFTVQTGAFSTLSKAKAEAAKLASRGITRTLPLRDPRGKTLYAVQIGRFQSKQEADRFRRSLGRTAFVTTAD
jgi:septal ring-binding cell division protein DamX